MNSIEKEKTVVSVSSSTGEMESVTLNVRGREIFYELSNWVNPSCDFAIWATLPIAMRFGGVLQINGATSAIARERAEQLSVIWSTWMPKTFRPVRVTSEGFTDADMGNEERALMLYSGGVDSTFALKRYVDEGNSRPDLLTIHGMDYRREDHVRFEKLKDRTAFFRETYAGESIEVRSNAASVMRRFGVSSSIGHGFQLFSTLFLFDATHSYGLAVDLNIDGQLDNFTDGKTQLGLTIMADFFYDEGWVWGAGFRREDSMHFEISRRQLDAWIAEGRL